jgi:hypothetical protein
MKLNQPNVLALHCRPSVLVAGSLAPSGSEKPPLTPVAWGSLLPRMGAVNCGSRIRSNPRISGVGWRRLRSSGPRAAGGRPSSGACDHISSSAGISLRLPPYRHRLAPSTMKEEVSSQTRRRRPAPPTFPRTARTGRPGGCSERSRCAADGSQPTPVYSRRGGPTGSAEPQEAGNPTSAANSGVAPRMPRRAPPPK